MTLSRTVVTLYERLDAKRDRIKALEADNAMLWEMLENYPGDQDSALSLDTWCRAREVLLWQRSQKTSFTKDAGRGT